MRSQWNRAALVIGLVLILATMSAVLGGVDDDRTWVRLRYEVKPSQGVPASAYTIIETLSDSGSQRARILFSEAERNLRIDLRVKESRRDDYPDSRWAQFFTVPGGDSLAISMVAGQVEIHRAGQLLLGYDGEEGLTDDLLIQAISLRSDLPGELMAALKAFARVGLARESTFTAEALVLNEVLFPELRHLEFDESSKVEVVAVVGFDPDRHEALPGELVFGSLYDIPGRIRQSEPQPASLEIKEP